MRIVKRDWIFLSSIVLLMALAVAVAMAQTRLGQDQLPQPAIEVWNEVLSVAASDESLSFSLAHPNADFIRVYRNGQRQTPGVDYKVERSNITFFKAPSGDVLVFDYKY